jgi:hypothetical protein
MGQSEKIDRLLVILTEGFPEDFLSNWVTRLPYLGTLYYQGYSATINIPQNALREEIVSFFRSGSSDLNNKETFLKPLEEELGKGAVVSNLPFLYDSEPISSEDQYSKIKNEDWKVFITSFPLVVEQTNTSEFGSDLDYYKFLDKGIENIALAAGHQTVVLVLALPRKNESGWLLSGGAQITAVGTPGMVELIDIPKTILWLFGVKIPEFMDGRLIEEILEVDSNLSQEEMDLLTDHLRGLGYLG